MVKSWPRGTGKMEPVWNNYQASGFGIIIQNKKFWNLKLGSQYGIRKFRMVIRNNNAKWKQNPESLSSATL